MSDRRVWAALLIAGALGGLFAAVWSLAQPERYSVTAVMAVAPAAAITDDAQRIDIIGSLDRGSITSTAAGIASSSSVRDSAVSELGLEAGSLGEYEVDSLPVLTSNLVDISVSGPDAEITSSLANAVGIELSDRFTELYSVYQVDFVTEATTPSASTRPSPVLVTLLGVLVATAATTALMWAAVGGRWRGPSSDAGTV